MFILFIVRAGGESPCDIIDVPYLGTYHGSKCRAEFNYEKRLTEPSIKEMKSGRKW